ncbi:thioredoxin-like protein [Lipomyces arxii]|uniref:thioredoxin-like protein n=1 Tax=Lipomyces arxii TaxID=56418 RepID=UPI0034D00306
MKVLGGIITYIVLLAAAVTASNVVELTDKTFDQLVVNGGTPTLVEFYARWCGHCKNLAPIYEDLADSYANKKDKIQIAKIDGDRHRKATKRYGIEGFPTIKYFDGKGGEAVSYDKGRNLDSFMEFITAQTGLRAPKPKGPPQAVRMLTDDDFKEVALDPNKDVLVAFTASWCGHCKAMAPAYEAAAQVFAPDKNVIIAKMDTTDPATRVTPSLYGVSGYPTIKFFPKGEAVDPIDYDLGRSPEAFVNFINGFAGTHRKMDGSLDEFAGIDLEFAPFIYKLREDTDGELMDAVAEAVEFARTAKGPNAKYYAKVIEKYSVKGMKYLKSEIARLGHILARGQMAREKSDQFTVRYNILSDILEKLTGPLPVETEPTMEKFTFGHDGLDF